MSRQTLRHTSPPEFFLPLYIYPAPGAWDFLHEAITSHRGLKFTIVINPGSGPGPLPLPDANYMREIPRLNSQPNVRMLGYIACAWAAKPLASVLEELATYREWSSKNPSLGVQGIFLDEAPSKHDSRIACYLETISGAAKASQGFGKGFLVINPGVFPDPRNMALADVTVVLEETYRQYIRLDCAKALRELAEKYEKRKFCVLMHSITDQTERHMESLVEELHDLVGFLFLTDLKTDFYAKKGVSFTRVLDALEG